MVSVSNFLWGALYLLVKISQYEIWRTSAQAAGDTQRPFWVENSHGIRAERADFQGERSCCLGPWEPVSQSHTRSALAADQGRVRHTVELLLPWRSFNATMGTVTIACTLLSILLPFLSSLVPFPLIRNGNIFGHQVSYFGEVGVEWEKGIIFHCICSQLMLMFFLRLLRFQ